MEWHAGLGVDEKNGGIIRMETLQDALIVAATVFLVLAFCSGIKAACRKMLSKIGGENIMDNSDRIPQNDK